MRAPELRDKDIASGGSELGEVEDIIVDLKRGRALALVALQDDVVGRALEVLMPVEKLDLTNPRRQLKTQLTREDFRRIDPKWNAIATTPARSNSPAEAVSPTGRAEPTQGPLTSMEATLASAARSARQALDNSPDLARANITVAVEDNVLRLRGSVATEKEKRRAESAVRQAASGVNVENLLTVTPRLSHGWESFFYGTERETPPTGFPSS